MATANPTAPVPTPATAGLPTAPGLPPTLQGFARMPLQQKLGVMVGAAALAAIVIGAFLWSRQPDYTVLFAGVTERDGGAIIAALQQRNVPYRFTEGGQAILVPANVVHDVRLQLASEGLPRGGQIGFELMDGAKLGLSQFQEQITYQRALEGELGRSIQSLAAVRSARVHLALPKQTGFLRDDQKPSASVLVDLYSGRGLDAAQVAGIVHLVAASVPQLTPAAVSVVDQNGALLSQQGDPLRTAGLDPTQLKYVRELEDSYVKRIEALLVPITGPGNFRAQVTADVDFSQVEQTAETYRPNQTPDAAVIRSQQTSEATNREASVGGVPGALTNQPPVPATAPITQPAAAAGATAAGGPPTSSRRDTTTNYEVDKTIRHIRQPVGAVKRLSVAVVLNHRSEAGADGKTTSTPIGADQMAQIQALVREAVGYSQERGDTINVANLAFSTPALAPVEEAPWWKNPELIALAKALGRWLLFALLAAYAYFALLRPFLRYLAKRGEVAAEHERALLEAQVAQLGAAGGALPHPGATGARGFDDKLTQARELARQDPKLVANVIKDWVGSNEQR